MRSCSANAVMAAASAPVPAVVGTVVPNPTGSGRAFQNAAAFCHRGQILATARKCLLPTYDVFDEDRYFEPATAPTVVTFAGRKIGITICEDIWTHPMISTRRLYSGRMPIEQLADQKCDLMVNLSASPWHSAKDGVRQNLVVSEAARSLGCPVAYVNAVGGNDELIFDGRSLVATANGTVATARVTLPEVTLGPYRDSNFSAWVNRGDMDGSLLGMDYLHLYRVEIAGDTMILRR